MALSQEDKRKYREQAEANLKARAKKKKEEDHMLALENELRAERSAADKESDTKRTALNIFLQEGGSLAVFEKGWSRMYEQIIYAKTIERMTSGDPIGIRGSLDKVRL